MANKNLLTRPQNQVLNQSADLLSSQLGQAGPQYDGQMVPGASAGQQTAFTAGQNLLNSGANTRPAINQMLGAQADPNAINNYYQQAFVNPAQQNFRGTMQNVASRYGDSIGTNGGFARAMGGAVNDFNTNLSGQLAGLQFGERRNAEQQRAQGVGLSLAEQQGRENTLSSMLNIGGEQRAIEGQQNQAEFGRWNAGQAYNNPWLQSLMGPVLGTTAKGLVADTGGIFS